MATNTTINRAALVAACSLVRPALSSQNYIPALTHIRFDNGEATAYNDVSAIRVKASLDIERCIPGDLLIRALGSFSGDSIAVQEGKDGSVVLSSGRAKVKLPTLAVKDFPFTLPTDDAPSIYVDDSILKGITRCLLSVGTDPTHPAQMGVTLDVDSNSHAVLFSTDNFTVSRYQTVTKVELPGDTPVILPTFFCEQLVALSKTFPEDDITMYLLAGALLVEFGKEAALFTKTLHELDPLDFPRLVDKHCKLMELADTTAPIPDAFEASLGRALLVLGGEVDKETEVLLGDGVLSLHSASPMGDADDRMSYETPEAAPVSCHIDPALVLRSSKVCSRIGFLARVAVLTDDDFEFVHIVAYVTPKKTDKTPAK